MALMAVLFISQSTLLYDKYFFLNFTANLAIGQGKTVQKPRNFGNNVWSNRQFCQKHYNLIVYSVK